MRARRQTLTIDIETVYEETSPKRELVGRLIDRLTVVGFLVARVLAVVVRILTSVLTIAALLLAGSLLVASTGQAASAVAWQIAAVTGPTNLPPNTNEVQRVAIDATGGKFSLEFHGQETGVISFNAFGSVIENELNSLSTIGGISGKVKVSGGPGSPGAAQPYFISFSGAFAGLNVDELVAHGSLLTGGAHTATVSTQTPGGPPGAGKIAIYAQNTGKTMASGSIVVKDQLPSGLSLSTTPSGHGWVCSPMAPNGFECTTSTSPVPPGAVTKPIIATLTVTAPVGSLSNPVTIEGSSVTTTYNEPIKVSSTPAAPGFQSFQAGAFDESGMPSTQAGGHPYSASTAIFFNTILDPQGLIAPAGNPHNINVDLPPGFVGNPSAALRCPLLEYAHRMR